MILALALLIAAQSSDPPPALAAPLIDGRQSFDFEIGTWHATIRRRLRPLTGSTEWVTYTGTSTVRPIWNGQGNLGELDVSGPAGRIRGMSLRLYDPVTRQWAIRWANARDGQLGTPMIGSFSSGRGLFYDQEELDGRSILVRFIFSEPDGHRFGIEQAFSADGGTTWETNWISEFTR